MRPNDFIYILFCGSFGQYSIERQNPLGELRNQLSLFHSQVDEAGKLEINCPEGTEILIEGLHYGGVGTVGTCKLRNSRVHNLNPLLIPMLEMLSYNCRR